MHTIFASVSDLAQPNGAQRLRTVSTSSGPASRTELAGLVGRVHGCESRPETAALLAAEFDVKPATHCHAGSRGG